MAVELGGNYKDFHISLFALFQKSGRMSVMLSGREEIWVRLVLEMLAVRAVRLSTAAICRITEAKA